MSQDPREDQREDQREESVKQEDAPGHSSGILDPAPAPAPRPPEPSRHYGPEAVNNAEPTGGFYEGDKVQEAAQAERAMEGKQETVPRLEQGKVKLAIASVVGLFLLAVGLKLFTAPGKAPQEQVEGSKLKQADPAAGQPAKSGSLEQLDKGYASKQGEQEQAATEQSVAEAARRVRMARDQAQGAQWGSGFAPTGLKDAPASGQQAEAQDPWKQARHQYRQQAASQHYQDILAARRAGVLAQLAQSQTAGEMSPGLDQPTSSVQADARARRDASLRALQMLEAGPARATDTPQGGPAQRETFAAAAHAGPQARLATPTPATSGRWQVSAGTLIELVLETGLNSDVPGLVRARVAAPVWDRTGRQVVVPTGSVLVGVFNARVQQGDERVQLAWTRLELPTGERIELGGQPGVELTGAAGVGADVDRHLDVVFEGAILSSIFSVGAALTAGTTSAFSQSPRQAVAGAVAGEFNETGKQLTRQGWERPPTLRVPPGTHIGVLLKEDMIF